jgi:Lipocalin-like domain
MIKIVQVFSSLLFIAIISSCVSVDQTKSLQGNWQCVSWTVENNVSGYDIAHTNFNFKENEYYEANISGHPEKGTYYKQDDKLYTTADGSVKIMTLIKKITPDTLILSMNRTGTIEEMILVKK